MIQIKINEPAARKMLTVGELYDLGELRKGGQLILYGSFNKTVYMTVDVGSDSPVRPTDASVGLWPNAFLWAIDLSRGVFVFFRKDTEVQILTDPVLTATKSQP